MTTKEDKIFDDLLDGKFPEFEELPTTKLGSKGEKLIIDWLLGRKSPFKITQYVYEHHDWDLQITAFRRDKPDKIFNAEIKTKVIPFRKYPTTIGIDDKDWIKYQKSDLPLYLFVIDVPNKAVYGQWINKLVGKDTGRMPTFDTQFIRLFERTSFKKLFDLSENQLKELV